MWCLKAKVVVKNPSLSIKANAAVILECIKNFQVATRS